jgi:hypothetical protein
MIKECLECKLVGYESDNQWYWCKRSNFPQYRWYLNNLQISHGYCPPCADKVMRKDDTSILV